MRQTFRRGQTVEIKSLDEIFATLDADGKLDGVQFMPEMAAFCGQRFRFDRTANRACEEGTGEMRRMEDAVFLEDLRCDGSAHDGCQRGCLIFWKTAWLKVPGESSPSATAGGIQTVARVSDLKTHEGGRYYCQSTELASATSTMSRWDLRPLFADLRNREITLRMFVRVVFLMVYNKLLKVFREEGLARLRGTAQRAGRGELGLEAGDCVMVKDRQEIMATVDEGGLNRGLSFEYDMLEHCGSVGKVAYPVRRIILEETGKMVELSSTVVLDGVVCEGLLRRNCPRQNYLYWREAWLTRCPDDVAADPGGGVGSE